MIGRNAAAWLRRNLFASPASALATVVLAALAGAVAVPVLDWAVLSADWRGTTRADVDAFCDALPEVVAEIRSRVGM